MAVCTSGVRLQPSSPSALPALHALRALPLTVLVMQDLGGKGSA